LDTLMLWENQIEDITPVTGLTNLTDLNLNDNRITSIKALGG